MPQLPKMPNNIPQFAKDAGVTLGSTCAPHVPAAAPAAGPQGASPEAASGPDAEASSGTREARVLPRKVFLAIAGHFGFNDLIFVQSLVSLTTRTRVPVQIAWSCDPSVERARNILTANFLESDCTHILFVDADIGFSAEDVDRISSHHEPIVGGMYPLKQDAPAVAWCGNGLQPGEAPIREDGLSPVKYIGTGFLCIKREVFEKLIEEHEDVLIYKQDFPPQRVEWAFWFQRVSQSRFLTEDWNFCQLCLDLGYKLYGDSRVVLRHAGRAVWPLAIQQGNPFRSADIPVRESQSLPPADKNVRAPV
jgi:hypothetical protein